jgi:macrodomain Ter protein organizer (MatP/YcbG family)
MAANVIIHRRDINGHQAADALRRQRGQRHHRFPPIEWPIKVAFNLVIVERIEQILRHRRVGHLWRTRRKTVVAHIDLQNIVVGDQVAGEDAQVVQAAKQTVDQTIGELLCGFCADCARLFNFMAKFFFSLRRVRVLCWTFCHPAARPRSYLSFTAILV